MIGAFSWEVDLTKPQIRLLLRSRRPNPKSASHWSFDIGHWSLVILILILLLAAALRLYRLDSVPPGLTHDEAGHGHDAVAILRGARPMYETVGYGREPLYDYIVAGMMALAGPTSRVLRFSPVPLGLITLLATFAWTRLAFDGPTALAAANKRERRTLWYNRSWIWRCRRKIFKR